MSLEILEKLSIEIQKLNTDALVDLYVLDASALPGNMIFRFHEGVSPISTDVIWQGNTYVAFPLEISGFESNTNGASPRPRLKLANVTGIVSGITQSLNDLVGCKVIRKRTFLKYLDAVNFESGVNPSADPNAQFPDELYFIDRKVSENLLAVEFELVSALDLQGAMLPKRQILTNICPWRYRGSECGYSGGPKADKYDRLCISNGGLIADANDRCGQRLTSCEIRFGSDVLPFGGFPGVGLIK